jgi:hypothetical protein
MLYATGGTGGLIRVIRATCARVNHPQQDELGLVLGLTAVIVL